MEEKVGFYLVDVSVSTGLAGAPTLHLKLGVNAVTGAIQGSGTITQALAPPNGEKVIHQITGMLHHTGFGKDHILVALSGEYFITHPPAMFIIPVKVTASLVIDASWTGTGVFTDGTHHYNDCKVKKEA